MSAAAPVLGVVGLGSMGYGAAVSAMQRGVATWGLDMSEVARTRFAAAGGQLAASLADLASRCDVVQVLVVNAAQTEAVLFGDKSANGEIGAQGLDTLLRRGAVVIASATVDPALPPLWEARLAERGIHLIDGPVSGGAKKAADGQMTVMASGKPEAFAAAGAVLDAIAGKVYRLGDHAGVGSTVKMVNQHLAGVHIASACEAMALGMRAGADPKQLYEVICNSAGMSWMFQNRVPHILDGDYTPLSSVNIFVKDLGIVLDAARKLAFPLPLAAAAHQLYLATAAAGHGNEDDAAVVKFYAELAGIELPFKA
jgi:3-hydroxyisobutyrate dehydrogenase